jgi:hypothetical protein
MQAQEIIHTQQSNPHLIKKGEELLQAVLERSATDQSFRKDLLTNPRQAIGAHFGKGAESVPANFNVKFIENTASATVVLPDFVDDAAQLSEEELETVAGGTTPACAVASAVLSVVASAIAFSRATEKLYDAIAN